MHYQYRFKFYVSARHYSNISGASTILHPHTWELTLLISSSKNQLIEFSYLETKISQYLKNFEQKSLNTLEAFINKSCTTEDIAYTFFEDISNVILKDDIILDCLELSENPTRTFIIKR
ncbi:MAG: 6-carboxytetrahydropterin synthase [Clostridium perfringens]|nr:6-carboxytetrahydropterin synthase [Clostridium perfringens]